jgi:hypothetical protein
MSEVSDAEVLCNKKVQGSLVKAKNTTPPGSPPGTPPEVETMGVAGPSKKTDAMPKEPPKKKTKAKGAAKKGKDTCVETCRAGRRSGCTIRGRGKPAGNLSCAEVERRIEALGADAKNASLCVKSAIMNGIIEITGEDKEELNQVVYSDVMPDWSECKHTIPATLGDLLRQPDYGGDDYPGSSKATVLCKICEENPEVEWGEKGRIYVADICSGQPRFDEGKFHNHCTKCPGFGMCIGDYREAHCDNCNKHYFAGNYGFNCGCRGEGRGGYGNSDRDRDDCTLM